MTAVETTVDEEALRTYLAARLGSVDEFSLTALEGGNANETFRVVWGDDEFVLRRPPAAPAVPELLHDVLREHTVLTALRDTAVPVPWPVLRCEDADVIGRPFYLMEHLTGDVLPEEIPARFDTPTYRRRVGTEIVDTLADVHRVDPGRDALAPLDAPDHYLRREVEAWRDHLSRARAVTESERAGPDLRAVGRWLADNVPPDAGTTLVHGDYKPDNLLFASGTPPRLVGVLDWEMCAVGDPLADLGWLLTYWADPGDPPPHPRTYMQDESFHTRRELVARYEERTGRTYTNDRFYRALALFKLASICEGFYAFYLQNPARSKATYPLMEELVPELATRATQVVDGDQPL